MILIDDLLPYNSLGLTIIQRNIRKWLTLRNWQWWKLYTRVKPLLSIARQEDDMKKKEEELETTKEELTKCEKIKKQLEEQNVTLLQAKNDLFLQVQAEQDSMNDAEERISQLVTQKADYEQQIKDMEERLQDEEGTCDTLEDNKRKLEENVDKLKTDVDDLETKLQKVTYKLTLFYSNISLYYVFILMFSLLNHITNY